MALLLVVLVVATGCGRDTPQGPPEARISFAGLPDGPAPAAFGGGPATLSTDPPDGSGTTLRIIGGKLTNDPTVAGRTAGYYTSADLGGPVTTIGARWVFTARGGTPGTMALVVSRKLLDFPFPVHLVITPNTWTFGVWPEGDATASGLQNLKSEPFDPPLVQDGTQVYQAQVEIEGERAEITLPNGEHSVIRDSRIADFAGPFATFEAYSDHGITDSRVGFTEIWAMSRPSR